MTNELSDNKIVKSTCQSNHNFRFVYNKNVFGTPQVLNNVNIYY